MIGLLIFKAVFEHGHAVGATDTDRIGVLFQPFLDPLAVDPTAGPLFHPHPATAGSATEGFLAVALKLAGTFAGCGLQDIAGR